MKGKALAPVDIRPHVEFFWQRVEKTDFCWNWTGKRRAHKYGELVRPGLTIAAHRFSWVLHHGRTLGGDETIDHRCRNQRCVNPDHLDAVSMAENLARTRGIYSRTPYSYAKKDGSLSWRVRFKDYSTGSQVERSKTFPTLEEATAWRDAHRFVPLATPSVVRRG